MNRRGGKGRNYVTLKYYIVVIIIIMMMMFSCGASCCFLGVSPYLPSKVYVFGAFWWHLKLGQRSACDGSLSRVLSSPVEEKHLL
jgi:hypothetical protein